MGELTFNIYIASYKRADTCTTHHFLDYYTYVVRKSEEQAYLDAGVEKVWAIDDHLIDSMVKVNQYIIDNAPEDIVAIFDDDIHTFLYRMDTNEILEDSETITAEIERIAQLIADLQIGMASVDATTRPFNYTQEFDFKGSTGGIRWINTNVFKAKLDEKVEYNYDLDMVLQELLINRIILKEKYFCSSGLTDTNEGGASEKMRKDQIASINLLKARWGRYFDFNFKKNTPYIRVTR